MSVPGLFRRNRESLNKSHLTSTQRGCDYIKDFHGKVWQRYIWRSETNILNIKIICERLFATKSNNLYLKIYHRLAVLNASSRAFSLEVKVKGTQPYRMNGTTSIGNVINLEAEPNRLNGQFLSKSNCQILFSSPNM